MFLHIIYNIGQIIIYTISSLNNQVILLIMFYKKAQPLKSLRLTQSFLNYYFTYLHSVAEFSVSMDKLLSNSNFLGYQLYRHNSVLILYCPLT